MDSAGQKIPPSEELPPRCDKAFMVFGYALAIALFLGWTIFTAFIWDYAADNAVGWMIVSGTAYGMAAALAISIRNQAAIRLEPHTIAFGLGRCRRTLEWRDVEARWDGANYILKAGRTVVRVNSYCYDRERLVDFFRSKYAGFPPGPKGFYSSLAAMRADRIIIVNESVAAEIAGDLSIYRTSEAAALAMDAIDVANGEYHVFRLDGRPIIQRMSGETVTLTPDTGAAAQPALVTALLRQIADHVSVHRRGPPAPSEATALELAAYIGFSR